MNLFEARDMVKDLFPDVRVKESFDDSCMREVCQTVTDGKPHEEAICVMNKVKFTIEGVGVKYFPITNHRMPLPCKDLLLRMGNLACYVHPVKEALVDIRVGR